MGGGIRAIEHLARVVIAAETAPLAEDRAQAVSTCREAIPKYRRSPGHARRPDAYDRVSEVFPTKRSNLGS
jgi:hypothetical protein